ncbi:unnamed protein product [Ectocarpus sp. 8 AP-2014]
MHGRRAVELDLVVREYVVRAGYCCCLPRCVPLCRKREKYRRGTAELYDIRPQSNHHRAIEASHLRSRHLKPAGGKGREGWSVGSVGGDGPFAVAIARAYLTGNEHER